MKIAQLAGSWYPIPPKKYGGTERVISSITEELVRRGHEVTLFATGDSKTSAKLEAVLETPLRERGVPWSDRFFDFERAVEVFLRSEEFDVIHNHMIYEGLILARLSKVPVVTTLHEGLPEGANKAGKKFLLERNRVNKEVKVISISNKQRKDWDLNFIQTVYNGIDVKSFDMGTGKGGYLIFVGKIEPVKKGILQAITVAKKTGKKLIILAKIDREYQKFFETEVKPQIDGEKIVYRGVVSSEERNSCLKEAEALLMPILWNEPFGLVMVEAMACGTPVIGFRHGSVEEVVEEGKTGFIVDNLEEMVAAVGKIGQIRREDCRKRVEDNFTVERMVDGYEDVYQKLLDKRL